MTSSMSLFSFCLAVCSLAVQTQAAEPSVWGQFMGVDYNIPGLELQSSRTYKTLTLGSVALCQQSCTVGCDFVEYNTASDQCHHKLVDRTGWKGTHFRGQTNENWLPGEIRGVDEIYTRNVGNHAACLALCNGESACQLTTFDYYHSYSYSNEYDGAVVCTLGKFSYARSGSTSISYRKNPAPINGDSSTLGSFKVIGNTGMIHTIYTLYTHYIHTICTIQTICTIHLNIHLHTKHLNTHTHE